MDWCTLGLSVHHKLLEFTQTPVHWVSDTIQPPHPLSALSPPAFDLSQHQGLFQWVSSSRQRTGQRIGVSASTSVLPMNTQDWSPLGWTGWISLQSKGLSRVFSNTTVQKHQFFGTQLSSQSISHIHTWLAGKTIALMRCTYVGKVMSLLFNMLSRLVLTFLPRSKRLLISRLSDWTELNWKMIKLFLEISLGCNKQFKLGCLQVKITRSSINKQFPRLVILAK